MSQSQPLTNGHSSPSQNHDADYNSHFTLANIPFGVVSTPDDSTPQIATRLYGDVFLIPKLIDAGLLQVDEVVGGALREKTLNTFASLGRKTHQQIRTSLQSLLSTHQTNTSPSPSLSSCSRPITSITSHLPLQIPDFSDFSCSKSHVLNASEAVTGVRALPPGFPYFPVAYAGRCSSIVVSGTEIRRPWGQFRRDGGVVFGETQALDFEVEVGVVVGRGTEMGRGVGVGEAEDHVFGFVLVNDWSARDIQSLEMPPLGPFQSKSFATTISPWIITIDALSPFRRPQEPRDPGVTASYLVDDGIGDGDGDVMAHFDVGITATVVTPTTATDSSTSTSTVLCTTNLSTLHWTPRDMLAHQSVNGCPLSSGDLLATGTISGEEPGSWGCLLEMTRGGKEDVTLSDGGKMRYLRDGDRVGIVGVTGEGGGTGKGEEMVGFGGCWGMVRGVRRLK